MPDDAEMYRELFRAVTRAVDELQNAQARAEEMYLQEGEPVMRLPKRETDDGVTAGEITE